MKLKGLGNYKNIYHLILSKIQRFGENPDDFSRLFELMFSEEENVFAEQIVGYKIKEITYGEAKKSALGLSVGLRELLAKHQPNSLIALDMANSVRWIELFWAILIAGHRPLLINSRLPHELLEEVIFKYGVKAVISDGTNYSACQTIIADEISEKQWDASNCSSSFGAEIIFMSSGTQGEVKLCAYTAKSLYYQICDTYYIVKDCPQIAKGHEGRIKQLALLPFYHVFGFMAVYLWFGFFSRTFVFLKDLSPQSVVNTVLRHKVTHVFAVPMVWERIYKTAMSTISSKDEKTVKRFNKGLKLAKSGRLGKALTHRAFGEVRSQIFGDSVKFMISGGSSVNPHAIEFLNAIGYHIANGYGMTELGITSVQLSNKDAERNSLSVGKPFRHTQYKIQNGCLLVKSNTRACKILCEGKQTATNFDEWFDTGDLATQGKEGFFIDGRRDDLIVGESGENVNPNVIEEYFKTEDVNEVCLFRSSEHITTLILSCPKLFTEEQFDKVMKDAGIVIANNNLQSEIKKIVITTTPLIEGNDFKISRKKVAKRYESGKLRVLSRENFNKHETTELQQLIRELFSQALQSPAEQIGIEQNFFLELGGNSLDYFTLIGLIKDRTGISLPVDKTQTLSTVLAIENYLRRRMNDE